ncbi:MAG: hypothetical protein ACT4RN_12950 [Pseudonocardia sp.]
MTTALDAAFGATPGAVVGARPDAPAEERWWAAVALGGRGRYAAAATLLNGLLADPGVQGALAAHAAVTLAAHRRQLGGHVVARRLDALGLRLAAAALVRAPLSRTAGAPLPRTAGAPLSRTARAPLSRTAGAPPSRTAGAPPSRPPDAAPSATTGAPRSGGAADAAPSAATGAPRSEAAPCGNSALRAAETARVDALVGLAADAIGIGDLHGAQRLLGAADRHGDARCRPLDGNRDVAAAAWRPAVRAQWVRAELALREGRAVDAVGPAAEALAGAVRAGALRHVVKSRIVLAVARAAADPDAAPAAVTELDAAGEQAAAHGLLPLVWPSALAAADLLRTADPEAAADRRHTALTTVSVLMAYADPVGKRLMGESVWVPRVAVGSLVAPFGPSSPT